MESAAASSAVPSPSTGSIEDRYDGTVTFGHRSDFWVALFVTLVSGVIFHMTAGRGAPFWDCGEFIACAYILGVPHPPGAALFVMTGRVASLFPIGDTAFILNLFSAYCSALAVGFCALSLTRVIRRINGHERTFDDRLIVWAGAVLGSLTVAFGSTYWFNAVEAEVYGLTMLLVSILIWLSMLWLEKARTPDGNRILLLQTFLLFLGATNHMQAFLPIIPMFLLIFLTDRRRLRSPLFYILFFLLTSVIYAIDFFLIGIPITCTLFFLGAFLTPNREHRKSLALAGMFLLMAILGYSLYIYVPIRSAQNPAIDENNPENWTNFKMFLERKQYSEKSMFELMFTRKGTFTNQFGTFQRIGFWGHLINQWIPTPRHVYLIVPIIVLFGLWAMWKKDRKIFLYYILSLLLFTVAMTLYLNFSDGTKGIKLEVRDRDYFYTPGFVLIGYLFGAGAGALLGFMRSTVPAGGALARVMLVLLLLVPPAAVKANYFTHDRSRFFVAEDLAYNMLSPLRDNAILFTGGDNDTFPLWYAQEVRHLRKDVRIVNLSLLNTSWYILQLKHQDPMINISLKDDEIEGLRGYYKPDGGVVTVKDIMVPIIIRENVDDRPIYFAVTVPGSDREIVKDKLLQEGLVTRLERGLEQESFDIKQMEANFSGGNYRFRGLADPTVYKDRDSIRLLTNYNACLFNLAQLFLRNGEKEKAQIYIDMIESFPHENEAGYRMLTALAEMTQNWESALKYIDGAIEGKPEDVQNYVRKAEYLRRLDRREEAIAEIEAAQEKFPGNATLTRALAAFPAEEPEPVRETP